MHRSSRSASRPCAAGSASSGGVFDEDALRSRLTSLDEQAAQPDLWDDREKAEAVLREKRKVEREIGFLDALAEVVSDAEVLLELAAEEDDASTLAEAAEKLDQADGELEHAELRQMLGGEHDGSNAIVSINAGAGGTDAAGWAAMLFRMYSRWAEELGPSAPAGPGSFGENLSVDDPLGDVHASGDYRVALARAYGKRALKLARDRALA